MFQSLLCKCVCSPVHAWQVWAAVWTVLVRCRRLSSCRVYSRPTPALHWDSIPEPRAATERQTDFVIVSCFGRIKHIQHKFESISMSSLLFSFCNVTFVAEHDNLTTTVYVVVCMCGVRENVNLHPDSSTVNLSYYSVCWSSTAILQEHSKPNRVSMSMRVCLFVKSSGHRWIQLFEVWHHFTGSECVQPAIKTALWTLTLNATHLANQMPPPFSIFHVRL